MDAAFEDDESNDVSKDSGVRPVIGMESVVATVSGYHGTERFKIIKLIACCGANYVGSLDRSITHLVCWQFEGKKYNLARKLKTHIVTHCWFEDCLKEGRRLPESPYTLQSGQEVGPISWKMPAILEGNVKKRPHFSRRNVETNHHKALQSAKGKEFDLVCINFSGSRLLNENSFHGWDAKKQLSSSKACRKFKGVLKISHQYNVDDPDNLKGSLGAPVEVLPCDLEVTGSSSGSSLLQKCRPESSSRSTRRLRCRRNFHDDADDEVYTGPTDSIKITEPMTHDNSRNQAPSPSPEIVPERIVYENEETRRIGHKEDMEKSCDSLNNEDLNSSMISNSVEIRRAELCESREHKDVRRDSGSVSAVSALDKQIEVSCVICWTEFCTSRGVLPCGHRFCYSCIQEWADCMASRGKMSTCPLCKANFSSITKFEELSSSEQKIFSQTIPCNSSKCDILYFLPENRYDTSSTSPAVSVCFECQNHEPEDLLLNCHICHSHWVHSCCLDPPLIPWTCIHCRDLRMLYQRFR